MFWIINWIGRLKLWLRSNKLNIYWHPRLLLTLTVQQIPKSSCQRAIAKLATGHLRTNTARYNAGR